MSLGKFFVVLVFGIAMTFVILHFIPSVQTMAFRAPTYSKLQGVQFDGWVITWTMIVFALVSGAGYKLVKR